MDFRYVRTGDTWGGLTDQLHRLGSEALMPRGRHQDVRPEACSAVLVEGQLRFPHCGAGQPAASASSQDDKLSSVEWDGTESATSNVSVELTRSPHQHWRGSSSQRWRCSYQSTGEIAGQGGWEENHQ